MLPGERRGPFAVRETNTSRDTVGFAMSDEKLKKYKEKLEVAINEALTESPQINGAIENIRETGYDVFLIIEATIGLNKEEESWAEPKCLPPVRLELTTQDEKFLRSLKINPE